MAIYDIGDRVRCSAAFTNLAGVATDPTTVTFKVRTPAGVETEYVYGTDAEVVRTAAGAYYVDVTLTASSDWSVRFVATGSLITATEQTVRVRRSGFTDPL
jgi:hypothetical protein